MPTPRLALAAALAALLAACGDRAPSTPAATSASPSAAGSAEKPPEITPPAGAAPGAGAQPGAATPPGATTTAAPAAPSAVVAPPSPAPSTATGAGTAIGPAQAAGAPAQAVPAAPGTSGAPRAPPTGGAPARGAAAAPAAVGPAPVSTVLKEAVAVEPGGAVLRLTPERDTVVDPGARFEVVLSIAAPDARLVLLDPKDALVAGAEAHEVGQSTRLTLAPSAPLAPGRRYTLRVDGAATRELHDGAGKAFTPSVLTVRVAGAATPEPKKPQVTRRRHHRR